MIPCPMPDDQLRAAFAEYTTGVPKFTRRIAIHIADLAGIPPMSMVWRLEKMGLVPNGSWDWFKANGGITKAHIDEVRRSKG